MIDNYIKVHINTLPSRTVGRGVHPKRLCELARQRIANTHAALSSDGTHSQYSKSDAPAVTSWTFPFDSNDEASLERARLESHNKITELVKLGVKPQINVFSPVQGLSLSIIGDAFARGAREDEAA